MEVFSAEDVNAASPVLTLPPEIVAEIFVDFLPAYPEFPPYSGSRSPLLLCRICRHWRAVALTTPALWKAISIVVCERDAYETQKLELLKTWIARSGSCPLSLSIIGPTYRTTAPIFAQLIETAVAHCNRWEHLDMLIPFDHLHLVRGEMSLLRDLTIGPTDLRSDAPSTLSLFEAAPQLRNVVLTSCFLTSTIRLPWAQLTHLEAHCLYEHECIEILRDAPFLVACTLSLCCSDEELDVDEWPDVPVHMHLRTLILRANAPDEDARMWLVLDCLTLPVLRTLEVMELCMTLDSLVAFVSRSQCSLDELRVTHSTLRESAYRDLLPSVGAISLDRQNTPEFSEKS
ncbi:hypothetical protein B0H14DRAFT_2670504 [Mycena olivaceomarginata]|nr:hypothetical protein B0H14DRAFT_2670504 [Mycena olivaceomarginata]